MWNTSTTSTKAPGPRRSSPSALLKIADKDRAKVIDALGKRLEVESQGPIRYDLALALLGFGKDAKPALPGLLHCAADPSCFEVRRICLAGVVAAGQTDNGPDPRATHALINALIDERASAVRLQGVMGLAQMGKSADPALLAHEVAVVRTMMKDRDKTVVIWAHLSMMALDKLDDDDVKYLTEFAKPGELDRYRLQAIAALGMVGGKERKVIPTLVDFLSEKQSPVIVAAACRALAGIGDPGEKAEAALIAVCKDDKLDEQVRFQAIYALASISSKSKSAIPALIELLADKDPNVIMTAIQALGSLEEPGAPAEQAITNLTRNMDVAESVRKYAEKVLELMAKPKGK